MNKYSAVVRISKNQDVNNVAEKLFRNNYTTSGKLTVTEHKRTNAEIVYAVSDSYAQMLYIIKPVKNALVNGLI